MYTKGQEAKTQPVSGNSQITIYDADKPLRLGNMVAQVCYQKNYFNLQSDFKDLK